MANEKLKNLVNFLKNVVEETKKDVFEELENGILQGVVEDMNTKQLSMGLGSDGSSLPEYSDVSVEVFGKRPGAMTMKDTGEFYNSINLQVTQTQLQLISNSPKLRPPIDLQGRYGALLGLTPKSQNELTEDYLIPEILESIKKQINKI